MIQKLEIRNFRSCAETSIPVDSSVCALVGRNGVGKTNILHAIEWFTRVAYATESVKLDSHPPENQPVSISCQIDAQGCVYEHRLEFRLSDSRTAKANGNQLSELITVRRNGSSNTLIERDSEIVALGGGATTYRIGSATPVLGALPAILPRDHELYPDLETLRDYYSSVTYYPLEHAAGRVNSLFEKEYKAWRARYLSEGVLPDSVAMRLLDMWLENRELLDEFHAIVGPNGLDLIDSFRVLSHDVVAQTDAKGADVPIDRFYFLLFAPSKGMGGSGLSFAFSDLSAGTQRVIRMVVSMLFDKRSVMLIEQPEDSIHPGLLRKLLDIFRSYSHQTQFIFSTHSSTVLDMLKAEELRLVSAPDGHTQVRSLTKDEVSMAKQFLNDEGALSEFYETLED